VRLDGDEMAADADDGDAGDYPGTYMHRPPWRLFSEQHDRRVFRLYESLSKLMSRHQLASFVITAATLLLMADATRRVISDDAQFNLLTWIALALMAYPVFALWYVQRRAPQDIRFVMAWTVALIPATAGISATVTGSPAIMMWIGVLLAIGLVGWVAVRPG
jgi:hypothetical protein